MAVIEFAPIRIPIQRRLQTAAVALFYYSFFFGVLIGFSALLLLLFSAYYPLAFLYIGWAYVYDAGVQSHGGRRINWMRHLRVWKYFAEYFPIKVIKTAELDPSSNYICGYHPHGVLCAGAFATFATEGTYWSDVFPGITPHLMPLMALLRPPFFRDYLLSSGMCDVSRESCEYILQQKGPGNLICLVIGGASESLDSHPDCDYKIILKPRKGFIKLALRTGSSLVPVFAFGETNLFRQAANPPGSFLRRVQEKIQSWVTFAPCIVMGRGIFQYSFGLLPHRRPVNVVVGEPIPVTKVWNASPEQVDELHETYTEALQKLFNDNKEKYDENKDLQLIIS